VLSGMTSLCIKLLQAASCFYFLICSSRICLMRSAPPLHLIQSSSSQLPGVNRCSPVYMPAFGVRMLLAHAAQQSVPCVLEAKKGAYVQGHL
jgi:hypothetical protein